MNENTTRESDLAQAALLGQAKVAYDARLHIRRAGSPACPDQRVVVDAEVTVQVPAGPDSRIVREAARQEAEDAFRELGLGPVIDLKGARVSIEVWLS